MTSDIKNQQFGFVAILGAPNAGKSTLLNQLVGEKISIVSAKVQTTRTRVLGLFIEGNAQVGLIDTPGIFVNSTGSSKKLDQAMLKAAWSSLEDADALLVLADAAAHQPDERTEAIITALRDKKKRALLALNKTDKIDREKLLPLAKHFDETGVFEEIFMISALTGDGTQSLRTRLAEKVPSGPWMFPEDQLSDVPSRLFAAEATREQLFLQLHDELPYEAAVIPESWEPKQDGSIVIRQVILVSREAHRSIVLGKNGGRIKALGQAARQQIAKSLGAPVHLFLTVKHDPRWQERGEFYSLFGLDGR